MKKIKEGQIKSSEPQRAEPSAPVQMPNRKPESSALADLGIEFGPVKKSPNTRQSKTFEKLTPPPLSLDNIINKGERISFNQRKKEDPKKPRKEINLSDLKKALEESLEKKEDYKPKDSKEELAQRIEEEKFEDKTSFPNTPSK